MTIQQMAALLRRAGAPDWFYVTDGGLGGGECVGVEPRANGWVVYYSERGGKSPLETCADEDGACRSLIRHVDQMMRHAGLGGLRVESP